MKILQLLLVLFTFLVVGTKSKSKNPYHVYSLEDICPTGGHKREIRLRTGAAIFVLNEEASDLTRKFLKERDLLCHLEVEAPSGYGFHVFMEEPGLDESPGSKADDGCSDYVQFGRDVLYITTSKSQKFCGKRDNVYHYHNQTHVEGLKVTNQGQRWYIEEKDHEMDVWLKVKKNVVNRSVTKSWRKIILVVTVFKKNCGTRDLYYKQCQHTSHCIRKDYFCDGHANCAWPSGDEATDEKNCDAYYQGSYHQGGSVLVASNIPVIIIAVIGVCLGIAVIAIFIKRFMWVFQSKNDDRVSATVEEADLPTTAAMLQPIPANDGQVSAPVEEPPSSPPSYEEVIKAGNEGRFHAIHDGQPPPYEPPNPTAPSSSS